MSQGTLPGSRRNPQEWTNWQPLPTSAYEQNKLDCVALPRAFTDIKFASLREMIRL